MLWPCGPAASSVLGVALPAVAATYDGVEGFWTFVEGRGRPVEAAALNVGIGQGGAFVDNDLEASRRPGAYDTASGRPPRGVISLAAAPRACDATEREASNAILDLGCG